MTLWGRCDLDGEDDASLVLVWSRDAHLPNALSLALSLCSGIFYLGEISQGSRTTRSPSKFFLLSLSLSFFLHFFPSLPFFFITASLGCCSALFPAFCFSSRSFPRTPAEFYGGLSLLSMLLSLASSRYHRVLPLIFPSSLLLDV